MFYSRILKTVFKVELLVFIEQISHYVTSDPQQTATPVMLRTEVTEHNSPLLLPSATPATLPPRGNIHLPQKKQSKVPSKPLVKQSERKDFRFFKCR